MKKIYLVPIVLIFLLTKTSATEFVTAYSDGMMLNFRGIEKVLKDEMNFIKRS
ncbi:MAG: hypothetical protein H0Z29_05635 [Candidatus Marinimicrobia bacterium]|nr:hypothetical protein [Candidatus Neomarinimicrobiota bacterium]